MSKASGEAIWLAPFEATILPPRELGAEFVATGHYARKHFDEQTGKWQLFRAVDKAKDQSYVLYHLAAVVSRKDGR